MTIKYKVECNFTGSYGQTAHPSYESEDSNAVGNMESSFYRQYAGWNGTCIRSNYDDTPTPTPPPTNLEEQYFNISLKNLPIPVYNQIIGNLPAFVNLVSEKLNKGGYKVIEVWSIYEGTITFFVQKSGSISWAEVILVILGILSFIFIGWWAGIAVAAAGIVFEVIDIYTSKAVYQQAVTSGTIADGLNKIISDANSTPEQKEQALQALKILLEQGAGGGGGGGLTGTLDSVVKIVPYVLIFMLVKELGSKK